MPPKLEGNSPEPASEAGRDKLPLVLVILLSEACLVY